MQLHIISSKVPRIRGMKQDMCLSLRASRVTCQGIWGNLKSYILQALEAVVYLFSRGICHAHGFLQEIATHALIRYSQRLLALTPFLRHPLCIHTTFPVMLHNMHLAFLEPCGTSRNRQGSPRRDPSINRKTQVLLVRPASTTGAAAAARVIRHSPTVKRTFKEHCFFKPHQCTILRSDRARFCGRF